MDMGKYKLLAIALVTAALSFGGCGDDSGSSGGGDDAGQDAGGKDAGPATTEMCIQMAHDVGSVAPDATIECLCDKCLQRMNECNQDPGCVEIRDCSDKTGCRGTACYFFTPECMKIIDRLGSTGLSVTLATQLNDCNDMMCMGGSNKDASVPQDDAGSSDSGAEDAGN